MSHTCTLTLWILLQICSGLISTVSGSNVKGVLGHSVTLPCMYSAKYYGRTEMCWGKGSCPLMGCSNIILATNGERVTTKSSSRYNLRGNIEGGDVSLTVENMNEQDSGTYCCRVAIPGLFNDHIENHQLEVEAPHATITFPPFLSALSTTANESVEIASSTEGGWRDVLEPLVQNATLYSSLSQDSISNGTREQYVSSSRTPFLCTGILTALLVFGLLLFVLILKGDLLKKARMKAKESAKPALALEPECLTREIQSGRHMHENIYTME
nr:PREDICTED: hepatitis A virus cellular receptor 2 isoform X1 [Latimeria chalumnae]|eukprot:XP_005993119.1 PREDICTED: hepatitis A virus cellular receptor 2 isoform X1 [Latimeria chalumnae]